MEENKNSETEIVETEDAAENEEAAAGRKKAGGRMIATRNGLYLRTVVGGMILYYAYTILADIGNASGTSRNLLYVFIAVFGIAGIWIILDSLKRLFKKEYEE